MMTTTISNSRTAALKEWHFGGSPHAIAGRHGVSPAVLNGWLFESGLNYLDPPSTRRPAYAQQVVDLLHHDATAGWIAAHFDIEPGLVTDWAADLPATPRTAGPITTDTKHAIAQQHAHGLTVPEIAAIHRRPAKTINKVLAALAAPSEAPSSTSSATCTSGEARACIDPNCTGSVKGRGYCQRHYANIKAHGHPHGSNATEPAPKDFKDLMLSADPLVILHQRAGGYRTMILDHLTHIEAEKYETQIRRAIARGYINYEQALELARVALGTSADLLWAEEVHRLDDMYYPPSWAQSNDDLEALLIDFLR
jgi:hypothetical protein